MRCKRTGEEVAIKFIERGDKIGMMLITGLLMYPPVRLSGTRRRLGLVISGPRRLWAPFAGVPALVPPPPVPL